MKYIDLNNVSAKDITGKWEVVNRMVNASSQESVFADIRLIDLEIDRYTSINGKKRSGDWAVLRENDIIYNPQLHFYIDGEKVGNAIITRFYYEGDDSNKIYKLTLYFNTGLELVLERKG